MLSIELMDYLGRSPKGRVTGKRLTTYWVNTTDWDLALEKAYRTHQRRIDQGKLAPSVKITGWYKGYKKTPDYLIL